MTVTEPSGPLAGRRPLPFVEVLSEKAVGMLSRVVPRGEKFEVLFPVVPRDSVRMVDVVFRNRVDTVPSDSGESVNRGVEVLLSVFVPDSLVAPWNSLEARRRQQCVRETTTLEPLAYGNFADVFCFSDLFEGHAGLSHLDSIHTGRWTLSGMKLTEVDNQW